MLDALWRNGKLAPTTQGAPGDLLEGDAVATHDIAWVGVESAPGEPAACTRALHHPAGRLFNPARQTHDRGGQQGGEVQGSTVGVAR